MENQVELQRVCWKKPMDGKGEWVKRDMSEFVKKANELYPEMLYYLEFKHEADEKEVRYDALYKDGMWVPREGCVDNDESCYKTYGDEGYERDDRCLKRYLYREQLVKPTRSRSAYIHYSNDHKQEIYDQFGKKITNDKFNAEMSNKWNNTSDEIKTQYKNVAKQDSRRYKRELKVYQKKIKELYH